MTKVTYEVQTQLGGPHEEWSDWEPSCHDLDSAGIFLNQCRVLRPYYTWRLIRRETTVVIKEEVLDV